MKKPLFILVMVLSLGNIQTTQPAGTAWHLTQTVVGAGAGYALTSLLYGIARGELSLTEPWNMPGAKGMVLQLSTKIGGLAALALVAYHVGGAGLRGLAHDNGY